MKQKIVQNIVKKQTFNNTILAVDSKVFCSHYDNLGWFLTEFKPVEANLAAVETKLVAFSNVWELAEK